MGMLRDAYKVLTADPKDLKLNMLIYFVTSHCNAKCKTCFYWQELNQRGDLTFEQIEKISTTAPAFNDLWLSGGEPSLRPELAEIIQLFVKNNRIKRINFPTNGLQGERVSRIFTEALSKNRDLNIYCNLSLDGLKETHEAIRGVAGNFERLLDSAKQLSLLKKEFGQRLRVNINTVICKENYKEVEQLADFLKKHCQVDGQYFQIVRGETMEQGIDLVPVEDLKKIYRKAVQSYEFYSDRVVEDTNPISKWTKKALYVGALTFHNRVQLQSYEKHTEWPMKCTAGITSAVLDYNGHVRSCELRKPVAHLRDYDYDFGAFWKDYVRHQEVAAIDKAKCWTWCTHVCFLHDSMRHSKRALFYEIPKNYFTRNSW